MKKKFLIASLASLLILGSCTSNQFGGAVGGAGIGGMLGSAIGGIIGGPRGSDIGTVIGVLGGGAAGAAANAPKDSHRSDGNPYTNQDYEGYGVSGDASSAACPDDSNEVLDKSNVQNNELEVLNVQFFGANKQQALEASSTGTLIMEIYNRSDKMLYNITPEISCNDNRVRISTPATIMNLEPEKGVRYRAVITAPRKLKTDNVIFTIAFKGKVVRNFSVVTKR